MKYQLSDFISLISDNISISPKKNFRRNELLRTLQGKWFIASQLVASGSGSEGVVAAMAMGESENFYTREKVPAMEAVLLGALAPGVNRPTWTVLKCVMLALGLCLATMLYAAFYSSSLVMAFHVFVLVLLSGGLFILLSWFLSQTGIVSAEEQMKDMNAPNKHEMTKKDI